MSSSSLASPRSGLFAERRRRPAAQLETDGLAALDREQRDAAQRLRERVDVEGHPAGCRLRDHLPIVRELAFDETHDERHLALARERAVALEAELDLVGVLFVDEALQLGETLARKDHATRETRSAAGTEVAIDLARGGDRRSRPCGCLRAVFEQLEVHAVQVVAGLVDARRRTSCARSDCETTAAGSRTMAVGENSGSVGNSSAAVPASVKRARSHWMSR